MVAVSCRGGKGKWGNAPNSGPHSHPNYGGPHGYQPRERIDPHENAASVAALADTLNGAQHKRTLFVLMQLVGLYVRLSTRSGNVYEGIFSTVNTDGDMSICLKMARITKTSNGKFLNGKVHDSIIVLGKDLGCCTAVDVESMVDDKPIERDVFQTDTAISGHNGNVRPRLLQKWSPTENEELGSVGLEDETHGAEKWDQFAANEKLFGVTTDFDEGIYTTAIDRSDPDFKKREAHAARVANEIERVSDGVFARLGDGRSAAHNVHVAEERGQRVDDSGLDEEDKYASFRPDSPYSSVIRQPGKYVPPAARRPSIPPKSSPSAHQQGEGMPAGATPAVATSAAAPARGAAAASPAPSPIPAFPESRGKGPAPIPLKDQKAGDSKDLKKESVSVKPGSSAAVLAKLAEKKGQQNGDLSFGPKPSREAGEVARVFKDFAVTEKKIIIERKQALMRKEKDGIINDFKKFSEHFKLKTPMPSDLQEILHVDKKEEAPAAKTTASKPPPAATPVASSKPKAAPSSVASAAAAAAAGAPTPTPTSAATASPTLPPPVAAAPTRPQDDKLKADARARRRDSDAVSATSNASSAAATTASKSEFKFNLDAAVFTPSGVGSASPNVTLSISVTY
ncbi:LsmAD domain-containing protein [Blyttiomyces helicus]|uniref:LsmAD domain-containing protein n=1 Tax=Blyttiomyces helicus TaxID=388810 RepID=A0A4V1IQ46_9FUNG|nr:LsmAD domain-containing protein [Blyttiomyces helicus]|eukprot:RKO85287.1 LsmAD domain-containing protein [Blyttiomyces helicus]